MLSTLKRTNRTYAGKRVGRGYGSGKGGHYSGRGGKGQTARTGHKSTLFFEGGNVPLFRRLPKYRGQANNMKVVASAVNVSQLEKIFANGDVVTLEVLREKNLIRKNVKAAKILGVGELTKKLSIEGLSVSESAKKKILACKGSVK